MLRAGTFVEVEASDWQSYGEEDWNGEPEAYTSSAMRFCGWLAFDYDFTHFDLKLSNARGMDEGGYHNVWVIPTGCITAITAGGSQWEQEAVRSSRVGSCEDEEVKE